MEKEIKPLIRWLDHYDSVTDMVKQNGSTLQTKVITKEIIETNRYLSKYLEMPLATKIFHLVRLRIIDDIPATIESSWLPMNLVNGIEQENLDDSAFYEILDEKYGIHMKERDEELMIVRATSFESAYLPVHMEDSLLMIKGIVRNQDGVIFEYFENTAIPGLYVFKG